tara:strand:+ start:566 stop:733 length:168 start_codon:yes stop_codon:yes gene_type:complete
MEKVLLVGIQLGLIFIIIITLLVEKQSKWVDILIKAVMLFGIGLIMAGIVYTIMY